MDLMGTQGADVLNGGAGDDVVFGLGGNDTIKGGAGNDVLAGNEGNDSLSGGEGDDYLMPGAGNDVVDGGAGNDWAAYEDATAGVTIDLNKTSSQSTGGSGLDRLIGIENVYGSAFNDTLIGDAGANMFGGGAGNDTIVAGKGDDTLVGDVGNDNLDGGDGDDYMIGGAGDDVLKGGAGVDWSSYEDATAGVVVDLNKTGVQDTGGAGKDTLTGVEFLYGSAFNDTLTGDAKDNYLWGNDGDDKLYGNAGDDHLSGGKGVNIIDGGEGWDTVDYSFSDVGVRIDLFDTVAPSAGGVQVGDYLRSIEAAMGSAYNDEINGNAADNYLFGDAGNDLIRADGGSDVLDGGDGDDKLVSSARGTNDLMLGGAGADQFWIGAGAGSTTIDGGDGVDALYLPPGGRDAVVDLRVSGTQTVGQGLTLSLTNVENVFSAGGNDRLTGNALANVLSGGLGDDVIDGGEGVDTVSYLNDGGQEGVWVDLQRAVQDIDKGAHGKDVLTSIENIQGSSFADVLLGTTGVNILRGEGGNDGLIGQGGADQLFGGDGDDLLSVYAAGVSSQGAMMWGGAGRDTFEAGIGDNILWGEGGDDEFRLFDTSGVKTIHGGEGMDAIYFEFYIDNRTIDGVNLDLRLTAQQEINPGVFVVVDSIERVGATHYADRLIGHNGGVYFDGGAGDDYLAGGAGDDTLFGGDEADVIIGGKGRDLMRGDGGVDVFKFATGDSVATDAFGSGVDRIVYFEANDKLGFDENLLGDVSFTASSATSYADALGKAMVHLSSSGVAARFSAFQVGADVYVFAGRTDAAGGHLDNVVQLAGVSVDLIGMWTFVGI